MLAQDRATSEEEKLSRLRELRSKAVFTPRLRRLTPTEVNKKQKKIQKRSAWASKNAEKCIKAFEEYLKEKEDG
ncbi:hypothetical protein MKX03_032073, partial [Papaver bracteatum]